MITKELKSSTLSVNYEYVTDEGKTQKKRQSLKFVTAEASDDDKHAIGVAVGKLLISNLKSIEDTKVYELLEG